MTISWRDSDELSRTLPLFLQITRLGGGDATIVDCGERDARLPRNIDGLTRDIFRVVRVSGDPYFNKARVEHPPDLFFRDCDILMTRWRRPLLLEKVESAEHTGSRV